MVDAGDSKDPNMEKMSFKFNAWKKESILVDVW
jgi:hypothetical protein